MLTEVAAELLDLTSTEKGCTRARFALKLDACCCSCCCKCILLC